MIDFTGHTIGRYQILEQIGQGGMAVVYKALDTRLKNEVAVKFINKDEFPVSAQRVMLQRFEREALLMASLNHPNIVKVMDYGEYEGYPYLVMPYMAGGTLKARMGKPLPWRDVIRIVLPLTQALEYAHKHQKGALHRDIKPSNILITESGEPVLTDFGIAKILENEKQHTLTGTGTGMGTPEYMAPEQWMGEDVDGRADLYALGVVMYELLTGRQPYKANTPAAVMLKKATEPLPRPRMFVAELPENVERVVLKALAKDPKDRFQSMEEFGKALEGLTAEPKSFPMSKWVKPVMLGLLGMAVFISLLVWLVIPGFGRAKTPAIEFGQTSIATTWTATPSMTSTQSAILTNTSSPLPSPIVAPTVTTDMNVPPACTEIGQEWGSPIDGMTLVCVPAGNFTMGSNGGDNDEDPVREVYLDAYWMDQTEVTNKQYAQCVAAGECTKPADTGSYTRHSYYGDVQYLNYPVINVDWHRANAYCSWVERGLPSEAQWEKAARGTDGRTYPWGSNAPTCALTNFDPGDGRACIEDTAAVGSYAKGASPYGALDMSGNVWEWVADWYGAYPSGEQSNPKGPGTGQYRVVRGGSWYNDEYLVRLPNRFQFIPGYKDYYYGFRCSRSSP